VEESIALDEIEQAYRDHGTKLLRALYAYTGSVEIAEDAAAEAFAAGAAIARSDPRRRTVDLAWRTTSTGQRKRSGRVPTSRRRP
jgi:DNA-directed RNA polymerase specialized sigma24 family protein